MVNMFWMLCLRSPARCVAGHLVPNFVTVLRCIRLPSQSPSLVFGMISGDLLKSFSTSLPRSVSAEHLNTSQFINTLPDEFKKLHLTLYPEHDSTAETKPATVTGDQTPLKLRYIKLQKAMPAITSRLEKLRETKELQTMAEELSKSEDEEMVRMVSEDLKKCSEEIEHLEGHILDQLVPDEVPDATDLIVEVNAGVGGQEAMLFAADLFHMYQGYATFRGWTFEQHHYDISDLAGIRSGSATLRGSGAFRSLQFEAGVHRVQRVPHTERSGRIHTSTAAVVVLPKPKTIEVVINKADLRVETCRSSGKGGQNVNKLETAVRLVHLPTGFATECQEHRTQNENRARAMEKLAAIIYQHQLDQQTVTTTSSRKLQKGNMARSEKIRTYNFPQDRITDHRIGKNFHGIEQFIKGQENFHEFILWVAKEYRREAIEDLITNTHTERLISKAS